MSNFGDLCLVLGGPLGGFKSSAHGPMLHIWKVPAASRFVNCDIIKYRTGVLFVRYREDVNDRSESATKQFGKKTVPYDFFF
jgi:hypothetical protein